MNYLLYYQDGFIRKFPLSKQMITIGRAGDNDLVINEEIISRKHLEVFVQIDSIEIRDQDSLNGTYVKGSRVKEATIRINESFFLKSLEFILKQGDLDEFETAHELRPVFKLIRRRTEERIKDIDTRYVKDVSLEVLKQFLVEGLKSRSMNELMLNLSNYLSVFNDFGNLLLCVQGVSEPQYSYRHLSDEENILGKIFSMEEMFQTEFIFHPVPGNNAECFYAFPLKWHDRRANLIYLPGAGSHRPSCKIEKFLKNLALEIELASRLIPENGDSLVAEGAVDEGSDRIYTLNPEMKRLIKEAKRIAASELFVLIQGESGTGKELFARIIHSYSKRKHRPLVAINCAAIPENLLESEFFGYEKGAFTGAHAMRQGKLELSSGGILILDEISEMPLSMQSKLLRALEEHEFFRVGGLVPIKVNLRIIALTNQKLSELIKSGKFREDLYYRLVHHVITLPSLRDRREDIPLLINHFTSVFSRQYQKDISGYSVKAFHSLREYNWPGNVRQLKNEVHRLVNLIGENGIIDYELLSDTIRYPEFRMEEPHWTLMATAPPQNERKNIISLLARNHGNKSRTARELNMTYQGLHKKLKRLGINVKNEVITPSQVPALGKMEVDEAKTAGDLS